MPTAFTHCSQFDAEYDSSNLLLLCSLKIESNLILCGERVVIVAAATHYYMGWALCALWTIRSHIMFKHNNRTH